MEMCRHCQVRPICRPRKLCHRCYYTPEILVLYPPKANYYRREPERLEDLPLAQQPTMALPGTKEKVDVMMMRAECRLAIFHPDDFVYKIKRFSLW